MPGGKPGHWTWGLQGRKAQKWLLTGDCIITLVREPGGTPDGLTVTSPEPSRGLSIGQGHSSHWPNEGGPIHPNAAQSDDGGDAVLCRPAWPDREKKPQSEMLPGPGQVIEELSKGDGWGQQRGRDYGMWPRKHGACQLIRRHHRATRLVKSKPGFPKAAKGPDILCKNSPSTRAATRTGLEGTC